MERWRIDRSNSPQSLAIQTLACLAGRPRGNKPLTRRMRDDMIGVLPLMLRTLYEHFRGLSDPLAKPGLAPDLGIKVGRNEPCPCGSGKKFKRCCGSAGA